MNRADYEAFTAALVRTLSADPRVLGLIAAGSMAATDHAPDEYSDHDFWIVTTPGAQEYFRTTFNWLPGHEEIILVFRETAHGLKVLYRFGHLVEYAVFAPDELAVTRLNSYRVLVDRAGIAAPAGEIVARTAAEHAGRQADPAYHFGQFLTNLWVGIGRHRRGERLSGSRFVRCESLNHLLMLITALVPADRPEVLDSIDPARRFEQAYPALGAEINAALLQETPQAAAALLALAERFLRDRLLDYPVEAVEVVRRLVLSTTGAGGLQ